jgi:hypothetical protein
VLSREAHLVKSVSDLPILEEFVLELDAEGNELRRISVLDAVRHSDFATLMDHAPDGGDLFHTNTLEVLADTVVFVDGRREVVIWAYRGTPQNGFHTESCGSNQRLPNGNTLISESDSSRTFEVDAEGQIVWEFYNPARAGEENQLIATLFEVVRLPVDFPIDWARGAPRLGRQ